MKRYLGLAIILIISFFMMGMGDLGGTPEGSIPMPDKDYKATITDVNSVETVANFVSINGKGYVKGKRGSANVTIPFENINTVTVSLSEDEKDVDTDLKLVDGKSISIKVDGNLDLSGKTDFGTIKIKVRDITKIEFTNE
ncbi:hypothetical protein ACFL2A_00350 [Thermodesulfobacteriota bacterium]